MNLDRCPSTLKSGFATFSPAALRRIFFGKKVSHILPFLPPEKDEKVNEAFIENRTRLSISGVQKKLSLRLDKNKLSLTKAGEPGQYILKPIPDDVRKPDQVPANEHVTMQIAEQIFNIQTAANAMIFFQDDQPAYITKRFDYKPDAQLPNGQDSKSGVEDFASLAQKTKATHGVDFKYDASYEELFQLLKQHVGPYRIEAQKLFRLILFNYAFSNGDAHLKNFAVRETEGGDYILAPAYDLLNTRIHVNDQDVALRNGLFNEYDTESFKKNAFYAFDDFFELGTRAELPDSIARTEIKSFLASRERVSDLVSRSFLEDSIKSKYMELFNDKVKRLSYSYSGVL
jgi:serine/threonine-protein kinase HipA